MGRRFLITNISGGKLSVPYVDIQDGDRTERLAHLENSGTVETEEVLSAHEAAVTASKITLTDQGFEQPLAGDSSKADKGAAIVAADSAATAIADAGAASASYVQAEHQEVVDLANDLKAKYNAMVTLVNELKTTLDGMND